MYVNSTSLLESSNHVATVVPEEYLQLMSIQFKAMRIGLKKVGGEHRLAFRDQDVVCPLPLALFLDTVNSVDQEHATVDANTAASPSAQMSPLLAKKIKAITAECSASNDLRDTISQEFHCFEKARQSVEEYNFKTPTCIWKMVQLCNEIVSDNYRRRTISFNLNLRALYLYTGVHNMNSDISMVVNKVDVKFYQGMLKSGYLLGERIYAVVQEFGFGVLLLHSFSSCNIVTLTENEFQYLLNHTKSLSLHEKPKQAHAYAPFVSVENELDRAAEHYIKGVASLQSYYYFGYIQ
ncbi:hypothetical protein PS15p_201708 [Mucor circinelloides]